MKTELKKEVLDKFWELYNVDGAVQALSWLETLKYYEEYCQDDINDITHKLSKTFIL
jgi:hypothetical protein